MSPELSVVGKPVISIDGVAKVTGRAKFYGDVQLPNMLHIKLLRSPYAQADIVSIDTSEAEALPGVELVMTYQNFSDAFAQDLHYVGDQVAAVVAVDEETAEEGCQLIEVQYEQKPFVLYLDEAMAPDAPQVIPGESNVQPRSWYYYSEKDPVTGLWGHRERGDIQGFGDVDQGFQESDVIVEDTDMWYELCKCPAQETRGCVASFEQGKLTVYKHTQGMQGCRRDIAAATGLTIDKVNVVAPFTGSSYGGKYGAGVGGGAGYHAITASLATMTLGKPVMHVYSREEEMLNAWTRGSRGSCKIGFKADGTLHAMQFDIIKQIGPGFGTSPGSTPRVTGCLLYNRNCQHMKLTGTTVYSNRYSSWYMQGVSVPQGLLYVESVMDKAAEVLEMDPVELRRKNHFLKGSFDASNQGAIGSHVSSCGFPESLDLCLEQIDWASRTKPGEKTGVVREGMGMSLIVHGAGSSGGISSAAVKVFSDATATFICGMADPGGGEHTTQTQLAAETLGIPWENMSLVFHDTDSTPYCVTIGGSCGTWQQGWPTHLAALEAKQKILAMAAPILEVSPEDLDIKDAKIYVKANPEQSITFPDAFLGVKEVWGYYYGTCPDPLTVPKEKGAEFVSLEVDTETGEIKNVRMVHAQDVGQALNPKCVEGELSCCRHGMEHALWSEPISDPATGRLLNINWDNYKVATTADWEVVPIVVEVPGDDSHPYGAAAVGEGAANACCATFSNAIYNAIGVRVKETPFTPDKILKALGKI